MIKLLDETRNDSYFENGDGLFYKPFDFFTLTGVYHRFYRCTPYVIYCYNVYAKLVNTWNYKYRAYRI